ncbi:Class II aaRS and biotin synthetases superfamily protein [Raphanus sativus]|uniref:Histidine--tRNA ligase, cytoplasmic n=1 Tax=Raphanus sativus TaxID=3726 RepID=A0A6J0JZ56_RAPSA|nr:histidine--tRNA ligase, cytoplasmic [Raphanus sativus]KAJ4886296.1 Class II aaRS and biotin synthetases superfamily protein [Raphanus sativus]
MATERRSVITLGGKGSSFSSSSVYKVACGVADARIDSSAIERFSTKALPLIKGSSFRIPSEELTKEEIRASLVVLLNKLLLSNSGSPSSSTVRSVIPVKILEILNSKDETFGFGDVEVTEGEIVVLEKSCASLVGVCSVIDHKATVLSQIVDSVAALSCEATKGDITSFSSLDSGDGFGNKDAIGVAGDLKVLLNGSKAVGKAEEVEEVSKIPRIHGKFRDVVRSVHSDARVELNSGVVKGGGIGEALGATLSGLCVPIKRLGECSFLRAKLCVESIGNESLKNLLLEKSFVEYENLKSGVKLAFVEEDPCRLAHKLNESLGVVWRIVGLEAAAAYFALSGGDKEEPKSDKKNKKKAVLGKGTSVIIQFIKERLGSNEGANGGDQVEQILNLYDPEGHGFDCLLAKVKEIVESNENRRLPKLPKGTRDFAQGKMIIREKAFSIIQNVFKKHGATALDTPVFELRETLMGKYGEDSKLIYDLADQGGEICSLRYDLTVPFARYVAMNGITSIKRYQIAKVYRRDNPSHGRYREFYQCDFDIAGLSEPMGPDFEVVKILTELLDKLEIGDYVVKLNHRKLLDGMLEICGVPAEKFRTICSSIDKLDKQSFEQVKKEMVEEKGLSSEIADRIGSFVKEKGAPMELLTKLREEGSEFLGNKSAKEALDELSIMFEALERSKCSDRVVFDLSLARGLDYYTGVIFEAVCIGAEVGSIAAGGRYDNLIGMFGAKQVPAVGMSLGIERVFNILENKQNLKEEPKRVVRSTETKVLVSIMEEDKLGEAAELASQLWEADISAEYLVTKRNSKHFDWAKGSKIPWMVVVGKTELSEGVVTLKKMVEGSEEEIKGVPRDSFVAELLKRL